MHVYKGGLSAKAERFWKKNKTKTNCDYFDWCCNCDMRGNDLSLKNIFVEFCTKQRY